MKKILLLLLLVSLLSACSYTKIAGDSMAKGLCDVAPDVECLAVGGQQVEETLALLNPKPLETYVLFFGTAGVYQNERDIIKKISTVAERLKNNKTIMVLPIDPKNKSITRVVDELSEIREHIKQISEFYENISYVDVGEAGYIDHQHLNTVTNKKIWQKIQKARGE